MRRMAPVHCLWPGLAHFCNRMAVCHMERALLPLSWVNSSFVSHGSTPYGASIIPFGLGYHNFAIVWLHVVHREFYCLWPGLIHLCYPMAVPRMARVLWAGLVGMKSPGARLGTE